ncbi:hypothetical protein WMY93_032499 [Mugilogobius chulae]|uniref:LIM zinc-binding domain-containing protein n=1 Tax=Mugilogobius chulae TaxID=88201 RepID=A0AAW0MJI2_9GOBI
MRSLVDHRAAAERMQVHSDSLSGAHHPDRGVKSTRGQQSLFTTHNLPVTSEVSEPPKPAKFRLADRETCYACLKTVYPLERLAVLQHVYHKGCFKCVHCSARLRYDALFDCSSGAAAVTAFDPVTPEACFCRESKEPSTVGGRTSTRTSGPRQKELVGSTQRVEGETRKETVNDHYPTAGQASTSLPADSPKASAKDRGS